MMLCRTVVINCIYLEIFTKAIQQISTGGGDAPMQNFRQRRRRLLKFGGGVASGSVVADISTDLRVAMCSTQRVKGKQQYVTNRFEA
jgi:hypothetical protein